MPTDPQTNSPDSLSSEDVEALIHAQQQLYGAKDPRAAKVYNFLIQGGLAEKNAQGGLVPPLDLSNQKGEGVYQMKDPGGQTKAVPYSQVQSAQGIGYQFAGDRPKWQYSADLAADPSRKGGEPLPISSGLTPEQDAARAAQIEQNASLPMQVVGGIAKGAGTLARPLLDAGALATGAPSGTVDEMLTPQTTAQRIAKYGTVGAGAASMIPAAIASPIATAGGLAAGTIGAGAGQIIGSASGMNPNTTAVLSDALGLGGGAAGAEAAEAAAPRVGSMAAKYFPSAFDNTPEGLITRAAKPGKNNVKWDTDVPLATSLMKSVETQLGKPIESIDDALQAAGLAKQNIWQQYKARLDPSAQMGATIDGNQIADAMEATIGSRTQQSNPALAQRVQAQANAYRRPIPIEQAEDFLSGEGGVNNELNSYYAKNKVGQRAARSDPDMAATVAEGDALRSALYSKMDDLFGPGAAQLKQAYGAISNVENTLSGRKLVWERQNPVSLAEQISTARGAGKIAKGAIPIPGLWNPGDILEGAQNIAVARTGHLLNDPNFMIKRAFANTQPATPFAAPSNPAIAGLLPRGAIIPPAPADASGRVNFTPPAYSPDTRAARLGLLLPAKSGAPTIIPPDAANMSAGERSAALMQYLRRRQQLGLPAQGVPIQLPSQF